MTDSKQDKKEEEVVVKSPFPDNSNSFDCDDDDDSYPDIKMIILDTDEPLNLHRSVLGKTSKMMAALFRAKSDMYGTYDESARSMKWTFDLEKKKSEFCEKEERKEKEKEAFRQMVKIFLDSYRFCGETPSFDISKCSDKDLLEYAWLIAAKDTVKEAKMVKDCIKKQGKF